MIFALLILLGFIGFLVHFYSQYDKPSGIPGPIPIPLLGNLLSLGRNPHLQITKWSRKYGPIVQTRMGPKRFITVHGSEFIRQAMTIFHDKPNLELVQYLGADDFGIIQARGEMWQENRRFSLRTLRDFGFGRRTMEELVQDEIAEVVDWIKKQNEQPFDIQKRFSLAILNSLWRITTGQRFEHGDERLAQIINQLERTLQLVTKSPLALLMFLFSSFAALFPNISGWNALKESAKPRRELFRRVVAEHKQTLPTDEPRDFVDAFLMESKNEENSNSPFHSSNVEHAVQSVIEDLFMAGSGATAMTLSWAILYILHRPEMQSIMHAELDSTVGKTRRVTLADRKTLPYTEAFMLETLRMSTIVPMGSMRSSNDDVTFNGYLIPKGTIVVANFYDLHHNPEIWGDPEVFRPERFLKNEGSKRILEYKKEVLMPFSVGRRSCLGEPLARDTLFLFLTGLLQAFTLEAVGSELPSLEPSPGVVLMPKPFQLIAKSRY